MLLLNVIGILTIVWEWLAALALTFWVGIVVVGGIVNDSKGQSPVLLIHARRRAEPLQWLCFSALFIAEVVTFIFHAAPISQSLNGHLLDLSVLGQVLFQSTYGFLWIARIILIFGLQGLFQWIINRQKQIDAIRKHMHQDFTVLWLILIGLILLTYALSAGVSQMATQLHVYAIVLDWLSFVAQCVWFGGLAYFGYVLLPLLALIEPDRRAEILTFLLRRFYPLKLAAICVLFISEIYLTTINLSNIQQFITETYGRTLLVKWILILILITSSAYALFVLYPKVAAQAALVSPDNRGVSTRHVNQSAFNQTARGFRQIFSMQSLLGAAVLFCTTLLAFLATPIALPNVNGGRNVSQGNIPTGTPSNTHSTQTKRVGDLSVTLTVTPAKIDVSNTVTIELTNTLSGKSVTNADVEISTNMEVMDMGTARALITGGTPVYKATFEQDTTFSMSGIWDIKLIIQLPGQAQLEVVFTVLFISG